MDQRILQIIQKHPELKSEFEEIYPELKESKDERIRKFLINLVNDGFTCFPNGLMRRDVLAYLKKQKEQKYYTYEQSKQAAEDCYYDKGYNTEDGGRCHQQSFLWGFEEGVDWCEQHKEQKPVWSEEDEEHRQNCLKLIKMMLDEKPYLYYRDYMWLKDLRPSWKPSEEQVGTLKQWLKDHELDGDSRYVYPIFYSLLTDLQKLL